jgi:hypothetical protein
MTDGNAIEITTENFADLHRGIAMRDLGGIRVDEGAMSAQLGDAGLEGTARARGREEEQHRQDFIAQIGMGFTEGALALQIPGYLQNSFDFLFGEVQVADKVATSKIGLHYFRSLFYISTLVEMFRRDHTYLLITYSPYAKSGRFGPRRSLRSRRSFPFSSSSKAFALSPALPGTPFGPRARRGETACVRGRCARRCRCRVLRGKKTRQCVTSVNNYGRVLP